MDLKFFSPLRRLSSLPHDLRFDLRVQKVRAFFAPVAERVLNDLIGDFLVAFADDDVDRRLAADELRQRRDHDRVAELRKKMNAENVSDEEFLLRWNLNVDEIDAM